MPEILFPTTVEDALKLTPTQAQVVLEKLEMMLMEKMDDFEPEDNVALAAGVAMLDIFTKLPGSPLAAGWRHLMPTYVTVPDEPSTDHEKCPDCTCDEGTRD